jgi:hypothetical protein
MQHLNTLWQAVNVASSVSELTRHSQTYHFGVSGAVTFYLQAEHAEVRINRWFQPKIEVTAQLQMPVGWRLETDQDEAGVYVVAKRRPVVGTLSSANFTVFVPQETYLLLKVEDGRIVMEHVTGTFNMPPIHLDQPNEVKLLTSG